MSIVLFCSLFRTFSIKGSYEPHNHSARCIISVFQMRHLRLREVKWLAQGYTSLLT